MASTLPDDTAPPASLGHLEAQAAPTHPRAPPEHLGSSPCGLRSPPQAAPRLRILRLPPPGAAVSLLGCDGANSAEDFQQINKAVNYAEMAFDQMQMHADLKVVNGDSANAALEKVMGMLGGNPAAIEAAKKAAAAAIQGTLATGEDAEAAQRNAIAAQLGRNAFAKP